MKTFNTGDKLFIAIYGDMNSIIEASVTKVDTDYLTISFEMCSQPIEASLERKCVNSEEFCSIDYNDNSAVCYANSNELKILSLIFDDVEDRYNEIREMEKELGEDKKQVIVDMQKLREKMLKITSSN
jgi:hypothetical protein